LRYETVSKAAAGPGIARLVAAAAFEEAGPRRLVAREPRRAGEGRRHRPELDAHAALERRAVAFLDDGARQAVRDARQVAEEAPDGIRLLRHGEAVGDARPTGFRRV